MNLTEDILVLLDYGRVKFIDNEIEKGILVCDEIENKVIEGYLSLVMKMNDI